MTSTTENPPASAPSEPTAAPKPNSFARITGALVAPEETFRDIAARPDWAVPLLLWAVLALIGGIIIAQKVDFSAAAREAIEQNKNVPADAMDRAVSFTVAIMKVSAYASPVLTILMTIIAAAVLLMAFRMMGGEGTFRQAFSTTLYAWTPSVIQSLIFQMIVLARGGDVDIIRPQTVVRSNLAFLADPGAHPVLFQILGSLDAFRIWTLVLFIIGFAAVSKLSKSKSAAIVGTLWLVLVLFSVVPVALRSMR